jgi:hypothetical protein
MAISIRAGRPGIQSSAGVRLIGKCCVTWCGWMLEIDCEKEDGWGGKLDVYELRTDVSPDSWVVITSLPLID